MSTTTWASGAMHPRALLTTKQAATRLGVTPWWVRELIRTGQLRAINIGGPDRAARWRIDPEDLASFMLARQSRARDLLAG